MWRMTAVAGLVVIMAIAALSAQATSVHACSRFIDTLVAEADLIVEGEFVGYSAVVHVASDAPLELDSPFALLGERDIQSVTETIVLLPSRSYRGSITKEPITIIKMAFTERPGGGRCGSEAHDPTGTSTIAALRDRGDGNYSLLYSFFSGDTLAGANYERALEFMASFPAAASLPALGSGPTPATTTNHFVAAVAALGAALLTASLAIRFRTRRKI